jgi:hypothetical protein
MSNITNTCLYHACTNITNIPSSTNMYHASTMCHNLYHQPCTITSASTMHQTLHHQHMYHTMCQPCHQPCTSTINTCTIPCANHAHQPCTKPPPICQYHQDVPQALCQHQVSNMHLNHVPNQEPSYASTSIIPTSTRHASNHVPQTMCLNHIPYHS